jgi:hypothetical protein
MPSLEGHLIKKMEFVVEKYREEMQDGCSGLVKVNTRRNAPTET